MATGRSRYTFNFTCNPLTIDEIVNSFLTAKGYKLVEKRGEKYYRCGDAMVGYCGFLYSIVNQSITIIA